MGGDIGGGLPPKCARVVPELKTFGELEPGELFVIGDRVEAMLGGPFVECTEDTATIFGLHTEGSVDGICLRVPDRQHLLDAGATDEEVDSMFAQPVTVIELEYEYPEIPDDEEEEFPL